MIQAIALNIKKCIKQDKDSYTLLIFAPLQGFKPQLLEPETNVLPHYTTGEYAPLQGFEPQLPAPKTSVLPVTPQGTICTIFTIEQDCTQS